MDLQRTKVNLTAGNNQPIAADKAGFTVLLWGVVGTGKKVLTFEDTAAAKAIQVDMGDTAQMVPLPLLMPGQQPAYAETAKGKGLQVDVATGGALDGVVFWSYESHAGMTSGD